MSQDQSKFSSLFADGLRRRVETEFLMHAPLIELRNVDVALAGTTVLRGLTWHLFPRENWAVLGANGSGKSTFLKLIRGKLWPIPGKGERIYRLADRPQVTAVKVK